LDLLDEFSLTFEIIEPLRAKREVKQGHIQGSR